MRLGFHTSVAMALKKPRAKRLKVSTGDERADGATASYAKKSRLAQQRGTAVGKTDEERLLEDALFGLDHSNSYDAFEPEQPELGMDWLGQKRLDKLHETGKSVKAEDEQDEEMQEMADEQVTQVPQQSQHAP